MAKIVSISWIGIINNIRGLVHGVIVKVDAYVILVKGEGQLLILGVPWPISMQAKKFWETTI